MVKKTRLRLWAYRLVASLLIPLVLLVMLELGLRIFGYGFRSSPLVPYNLNGRRAYCDNHEFPWRFFSREISRDFDPFIFIDKKPASTYRIFLLGGSAAQGVPDGAFAFGRILEAMLQEAFPWIKFELFNTALTAVNSHVALPLAREWVKHQADLLIIYMGNNEVVGPYGPGTVFNPFYPSLALIRFNMALKTLRLGQLLNRLAEAPVLKKNTPRVWRGMEMFLERQIRADAPQLKTVYRHFKSNLDDIGRVVTRKSSALIFCTVAANLKDCPPFASLHRKDLSPGRREEWEDFYNQGIEKEAAADHANAAKFYLSALGIDDCFADLHFRLGRCYWQLGDYENAGFSFLKARELDTLRFRADSQINFLLRETAAGQEGKSLYLADIEEVFRAESDRGIPGEDFFYDHVHMNFRGNYLVALTLFNKIKPLLPDETGKTGSLTVSAPSAETVAEKLAYSDWDRYQIADEMLNAYIKTPPFTNQLYHAEQVTKLERELTDMRSCLSNDALQESAELYEQALARAPQDWWLHWKYAQLLHLGLENDQEALDHLETITELLPHSVRGYSGVAFIRQRLGDADGAIDSCLRALAIDPAKAEIENTLALAFMMKGWRDKAKALFKKIIDRQPLYVAAYLNLAMLSAKSDRLQDAVDICRQGLKNKPHSPDLTVALADYLNQLGRRDEAVEELKEALRSDPRNELVNQKLNAILWEKAIKK
jgi:tetratricopeptide (TPR) repeat protein